jgi:uncharacterized protein (DUF1800 family)
MTAHDPIARYRLAQSALADLSPDERIQARRALLRANREQVETLAAQTLLGAVNAPDRAGERLLWFWFNHFNVFWQKGLVGAALPDYLEHALRPHLYGRFGDMLRAVLTHPAMLVYLDNVGNVAGKGNENLARELLELHTLGVDGGYSQADVRETARVLTGLGLRPLKPGRRNPEEHPLARQRGEFLFNPHQHDAGAKQVLGRTIEAPGFAEVDQLIELLVAHPATARHVTGKLARFLYGDAATDAQRDRAAKVFQASAGDLAATLEALRAAADAARPARTFKDPYRYVLSAVDLLRDGRPITDARPLTRWLATLGQPMFACRTPDGYSLAGDDWLSPGQLAQRFELAATMARVVPRLTEPPREAQALWRADGTQTVYAALTPAARQVIAAVPAAPDRLALLLSAPEFMYW